MPAYYDQSNLRPCEDSQFSGYKEDYEEGFREIAERHLGWKSINKSEILGEDFFFLFREHLNFGTKIQKSEQDSARTAFCGPPILARYEI